VIEMMKKFLLLAIYTLFASSLCMGQSYTLPLWTDEIPNYQKTDEVETRDTTNAIWKPGPTVALSGYVG
jgi:hypothetical protein